MKTIEENSDYGKSLVKKYYIRRLFRFGTFAILGILFFWFLLAIPRLINLKKKLHSLQNKNLSYMIVLPDTMSRITCMPNFSRVDWHEFSRHIDDNGVVLTDFTKMGNRGVTGKQRSPAEIAGFSVRYLSIYLKNGQYKNLLLALRQIDYLSKTFKVTKINSEEVGFWEMNFDLGYQYSMKAPWRSGFHQAHCLRAMLAAYQITGDSMYIDILKKGIRAYKYEVSMGGLSHKSKNGGLFFEEVASTNPHHILNGHMIALIIISECAKVFNSSETKYIFERGCSGLKELLPDFDRHNYSLYSLAPAPSLINHFNIASPHYHSLHIAELRTLADITGEKVYDSYADKWVNKTNGLWENTWIITYVMFQDMIRTGKLIESWFR